VLGSLINFILKIKVIKITNETLKKIKLLLLFFPYEDLLIHRPFSFEIKEAI